MFRLLDHRAGHYLLLVALWAVCCLPNLGAPTLWDIDEGLNAEAGREMLASGNFVVPTFNYQLRSAKPALLYWLQAGCYTLLGVNETAARLPSALAGLLAILATYELGRTMFSLRAALLAGIIVGTSASAVGAAHFANPDALLLAFTTWTLTLYFRYWQTGNFLWLWAASVACGLAVLAKGPIGLVLPGAVVVLFLLWQRELHRLVDLHLAEAILIFLVVAAPWYIWVGVETKGQFLRAFLAKDHWERAIVPMEGHGGSYYYYAIALVIGLFPWSIFLGTTIGHTAGRLRAIGPNAAALRYLLLWFTICFVAFSIVQTKLPNYILPLYPAAALLTASMLDRWHAGEFAAPAWLMHVSLSCLALGGVAITTGMLVMSGAIPIALPVRLPELAPWAWIGLPLLAGAATAWWMLMQQRRTGVLVAITVATVTFLASTTAGTLAALNEYKASRHLAATLPGDHEYREVRLGAFCYDRPSLVFYCRREVQRLNEAPQALGFLAEQLPAYLFVPESRWRQIEAKVPPGVRILGRYPDLYGKGEPVLVVTNAAGQSSRLAAR